MPRSVMGWGGYGVASSENGGVAECGSCGVVNPKSIRIAE